MGNKITIYCDGGSRGNPGPAAIGVVIDGKGKMEKVKKEYSLYLGKTTNNDAEYQAAIFGLKKVKQLIGKEKAKQAEIEVKADSELLINQINGDYKIKEKSLIPNFIELWNLKQDFKAVNFVHIPREKNKKADFLVNRELDSQQKGLF